MTVPVPGQLTYTYTEDGVTTVFPYPVRFFEDDELIVSREVGGVRTALVLNTDYTVTGAGDPAGGSIALTGDPGTGSNIIIMRRTDWKQSVDLADSARNPAQAVEDQLDRFAMAGQDLGERLDAAEIALDDKPNWDDLGDLAVKDKVNNGDWQGTALAVSNGGTGAGTAAQARTNLGLGSSATLDASYFVAATTSVSAGTGLTGGGSLAGNRTISLDTASIASLGKADTAVQPSDLGDLASKDKVEVSDIDASGSPSNTTFLRGDGEWATPSGSGGGISVIVEGTGIEVDDSDPDEPVVGLSSAVQSSLAKADSAVQPADLGDLAAKDTVSVSDISASGTASAVTFLRGDGTWSVPSGGGGGGGGDMLIAIYDPNNVGADAFDMDNMVEGSTNLIFTQTERDKLDGIEDGAQVNPGNATTSAAGLMSASDKSKLDGIASGATANTGTVTSVGVSVPTGFSVSGSPVTSSGTITVSYASGYQGYTTAEASKLAGIAAGAQVNPTVGTTAGTVAAGNDSRITGALQQSGGTMTGFITLHAAPTSNMHAANKQYVDNAVASAPSVYTGSTQNETNFPIGHSAVFFGSFNRNAEITTPKYSSSDPMQYVTGAASGTALSGTWRARGIIGSEFVFTLGQRTA